MAIVAAVAGFVLALNLPHRASDAICDGPWRALLAGGFTALVELIRAFVAGFVVLAGRRRSSARASWPRPARRR